MFPANSNSICVLTSSELEDFPTRNQTVDLPNSSKSGDFPTSNQTVHSQPATNRRNSQPATKRWIFQPATNQWISQPATKQWISQPATKQWNSQPATSLLFLRVGSAAHPDNAHAASEFGELLDSLTDNDVDECLSILSCEVPTKFSSIPIPSEIYSHPFNSFDSSSANPGTSFE